MPVFAVRIDTYSTTLEPNATVGDLFAVYAVALYGVLKAAGVSESMRLIVCRRGPTRSLTLLIVGIDNIILNYG